MEKIPQNFWMFCFPWIFRTGKNCFRTNVLGEVGYDVTLETLFLRMSHTLCDRKSSGHNEVYFRIVRHEFLHVFGLMHTQTRDDRRFHISINYNNLPTSKEDKFQYDVCRNCDTLGVDYECHSIMHYGPYDNAINPKIPTITSKSSSCDFDKKTSFLTKNDWLLLHKAASCPGKPKSIPTGLHNWFRTKFSWWLHI